MSFDVASELKSAIAKENDEERRTILMLLLGVFEANLHGIDQIGKKIDALLTDEKSLREAVLNGHESVHSAHHDWIAKRIAANCNEACDWVNVKRAEEAEAAKDVKADWRAARDAVIRQVVSVLVGGAIGVIGALWMLK